MTARALLEAVANEMRSRKINHGKDTSPTLIAWADRIDEIASSLEGQAEDAVRLEWISDADNAADVGLYGFSVGAGITELRTRIDAVRSTQSEDGTS